MRISSLAVITPVHASHTIFLQCLSRSLIDLEAEWIVALDGHSELPKLPRSPDLVLASPRVYGASSSRNRCLASVSAEMVATVDADDVCIPEGICKAATRIDENTGACGYASYNFCNSLGDINMFSEDTKHLTKNKTWQPGEIAEYYFSMRNAETRWFKPFRSNCAVFSTDALMDAGGWSAMPVLEDLHLLMKINRESSVDQITDAGTWRRLHQKQTSQAETYLQERQYWDAFLAKQSGTSD